MLTLLAATILLRRIEAQLNQGSPGTVNPAGQLQDNYLCNHTFADANSFGIVSFDPDVGAKSGKISWASTVAQSPEQDQIELSLWFSSQGANYSDNYSLGYDVCYLWISQPTINTEERGQSDDGDCHQMFNQECVDDFTSLTNQYSTELVGVPSPGPNSNLSAKSLPRVCADLGNMLTQNFPQSCKVFFNESVPMAVFGGAPALGGALTGPESLVERSYCQTKDDYSLMWMQYSSKSVFNYYLASYIVTPLITAFMPIADANRPTTLAYTKSNMTCLRSKNVNPGSQIVPPAPSPTPVDTLAHASAPLTTTSATAKHAIAKGRLSAGAVAGIVVGIVLGLALVAAAAAFFILRKREERRNAVQLDDSAEKTGTTSFVSELPNHYIFEMDAGSNRAELGAKKDYTELPGHHGGAINQQRAELG